MREEGRPEENQTGWSGFRETFKKLDDVGRYVMTMVAMIMGTVSDVCSY